MSQTTTSKSAAIRAKVKHPIIDSDGHTIEFEGGIEDALNNVGGRSLVERFNTWTGQTLFSWNRLSPQERRDRRATRNVWWGVPTKNTLDRATVGLPRLLYSRLDEMGVDLVVLYPTLGLPIAHLEDEELRKGTCRAFNQYYAQVCREYSDRIIPVAVIPMHTPQEALDELDYAVKVLGLKVLMLPSYVSRPWLDTYGLDSAYDYDPVWAKCLELKVAPTFHSPGIGWGSRTSISNFIYNRIGHFAAAGEAVCKSLFMGGVTRRFPGLKFAFLECGVGWACSLYADLVSHWEKRNLKGLENTNPANLNRELMVDLYSRYGGRMVEGKLDRVRSGSGLLDVDREDPAMLDEFAPCGIERTEDICDLFVSRFYFGCEADDPITAWAFNRRVNPFQARLNTLFSSDIGHWDVLDVARVVEEAYELVEKGLLTDDDFRDFVFTNPVSFYTGINPAFFNGTVIETEVKEAIWSAATCRRF